MTNPFANLNRRPPRPNEQCLALRMRYRDAVSGERVQCTNARLWLDMVTGEPVGWRVAKTYPQRCIRASYCKYHYAHRRRLARGSRVHKGDNVEHAPRLPVAYSKYLSESLASRLKAIAEQPIDAQLDMSEDLALARLTAVDAARLYDIAQAALMASQGKSAEDQMRALNGAIAAGQVMRDVVNEVGEISERAASIWKMSREFIGVQSIPALVNQIVGIVHDELGEEPERIETVKRIAARVDQIRLPNENRGTLITPDMDAIEMDASVPDAPRITHEQEAA